MPECNYAVISEQNQRTGNEDSFLASCFYPFGSDKPLILLGIADGMGGHEHGADISREALRRMHLVLFEQLAVTPALNCLSLDFEFTTTQIKSALQGALNQTNTYIRRMIVSNKWGKAGSTLVLAALYDNQVWAVNLGDSPLYHYAPATLNLTQVTEDHTVAGVLLRAGVISPEIAKIHEGNGRLEFFIGQEQLPKCVTVHELTLAAQDLLLLCSDGISGVLSLENLQRIIGDAQLKGAAQTSPQLLAETICEAATDLGATDNQTLIIWQHQALAAPSRVLKGNQAYE